MAELEPLFSGLIVRDVDPLPPRDLLLVLERADPEADSAGVGRLLISASPDLPRLHLQHGRVQRHSGPAGPFYQALRAALPGRRLVGPVQVAGDRLVRLEFRAPGESALCLLAELLPRHANLVLLEGGDRVAALLVPPPAGKADARLSVGRPWTPPPGRPPRDPGPSLTECTPTPPPRETAAPLSWRVESSLGAEAEALAAERLRRRLRERVQRRLGRARALLAGLEKKRASSREAERVREDGELLAAHPHLVRRGARWVEVPDFFAPGQPPRRIELDPRLDARANVERLFARHRKLVRAGRSVAAELARARERLEALEELSRQAEDPALDRAALKALGQTAVENGLLEPEQEPRVERRRKAPARLPYRVFQTAAGSEVRVGRSARDNDALTFRHARGNDLWLHTADAPGSHVVLRLARGAEPQAEDVLDAAHLAIHFSPLRGATRARVHVARQKEVRKPRGAKPGLVHLAGGRTRQIRVQPGRLERLLGPRSPGSGGER